MISHPHDDSRTRATSDDTKPGDPQRTADRSDERAPRTWPDPPAPFLSQPRAHSALRHQLDAIVDEIQPSIAHCRATRPEETFELIVFPFRVVARINDEAVTFSWVSGRLATVADGCLLVIAWENVPHGVRGVAALKSATPAFERTYVVAGASADEWRWCASDLVDAPRSTRHLTADWMARTTIARGA